MGVLVLMVDGLGFRVCLACRGHHGSHGRRGRGESTAV